MESVATWVVLTLVVVSTTRLLIVDEFPPVARLREAVIDWFAIVDPHSSDLVASRRWGKAGYAIAYLWTCYWCMSFWVSLVALGAAWLAGIYVWQGWAFPLVARLAAGVWGMIESRSDAVVVEAAQRVKMRERQ